MILKSTSYFVYLLECSNGNYYTGYTTDLERRYKEHREGSAKCKYTRSFPPLRIAAHWRIETDLSGILKIEAAIKRLSKIEKHKLCQNPATLNNVLKGSTEHHCATIFSLISHGVS
jgi:putative endonuclease